MYADTIVNLALMVATLLCAPLVATALRLESQLPVLGVAGLFGLGAACHWMAGRSGSHRAVRVMAMMDATVVLATLFLATFNVLDAPASIRGVLVLGGVLALLMGALKLLALRASRGQPDL